MLRFTPKQVAELRTIIDRHTRLFVGVHVGHDFLSQADLDELAKHGIKLPSFGSANYLESAFRFGLLSTALGNEATKYFTYNKFKSWLDKGNFLPLTGQEKRALDHVRNRAYNDITGLGQKIVKDVTGDVMVNSTAQATLYRDLIRDTTADAIQNRLDAKQLVSALGNKTQDWARDFHRIADYLMHEAFDTARAQGFLKLYGPSCEVFKDVYERACPTCQRLYLTGDIGSEPRTFTLLELMANGTNVGRRAAELLPVIGPTHPYCFTKSVPIFTSKGWKQIQDIEVGDLVMTHARRFRPVTALIRHTEKAKDTHGIFSLKFSYPKKNGKDSVFNISRVTGTHPFMTNKGWRILSDIKEGTDLYLLHGPCKNKGCEELVPIYKGAKTFCSKRCSAKHNTKNQWLDSDIRNKMSQGITRGNHSRYKDSTKEQRFKDTEKARKAVIEKYPDYSFLHTEEVRSKVNSSNGKRKTFLERKLHYFLESLGIDFVTDMTVLRNETRSNVQKRVYYPDIYIPSLNMVLEADGEHWHNETETELSKRDNDIKELIGADVFHFAGNDIINNGDKVFEEIKRLVSNHKGEYRFKRITLLAKTEHNLVETEKVVDLYNFSVQDDESYIANGILVHNCRCTLNNKPLGSVWDPTTRQFELRRYTPPTASDRVRNRTSKVKVTIT